MEEVVGQTPDVELIGSDFFPKDEYRKGPSPQECPRAEAKRSTRRASLVVGIAVGEGDPIEVRIKRGADLERVADQFAREHGLLDGSENKFDRLEIVQEVLEAL